MQYEVENLLPLIRRLSEKYTSKESTSISYETAEMLMRTIIFCIRENFSKNGQELVNIEGTDLQALYEKGYEIIVDKVQRAVQIYNQIIADFDDYGCKNYQDTILKEIPKFFLKYDPSFNAADCVIMPDYPLLEPKEELMGIDFMLYYLKSIKKEQETLKSFSRDEIIHILEEITPMYRVDYYDNVLYAVLKKHLL